MNILQIIEKKCESDESYCAEFLSNPIAMLTEEGFNVPKEYTKQLEKSIRIISKRKNGHESNTSEPYILISSN